MQHNYMKYYFVKYTLFYPINYRHVGSKKKKKNGTSNEIRENKSLVFVYTNHAVYVNMPKKTPSV